MRLAPKRCLAEPQPPALRNVVASGGSSTSTPVTLSWAPLTLPPDTSLHVQVSAAGSCGSQLIGQFVAAYQVPRGATTWTDPDGAAHTTEPLCYQLQPLNYWGGGSTPYRTTR